MTNKDGPDPDDAREEPAHESPVPDVPLSLDGILDLLADHQRREILQCLVNSDDDTATIGELSDQLITQESERTGARPGRDQVEVRIYHTHLPKLTEAGIVEYDARTQELHYWKNPRLENVLEYVQSKEQVADDRS